ncbi:MAG TPA: hypothetical protein VFY31_08350 [Macromonas sp.]|nr:hypothetical protein [Macromonas sp.]
MEQDFEKMPLTPYDEYPVHTTPYPMSYVPNTDYSWDDGYYFGVYSIEHGIFMLNGMRIAPNSNMIGAHSSVNVRGKQRTLRLSRVWRDDFSIGIGPMRYEFLEPLKTVRLVLEPNESGMSYDIVWRGLAPPHLSAHHRAVRNGRYTTDQSRYNQVGSATGWIEIDGQRYDMNDSPWGAVRDRSWGLYESRPPLSGAAKWLPPAPPPPIARALRFSCFLESEGFSSYFHFHEGADGENVFLNDAFGTPFEGWINFGWDGPALKLVAHRHELQFAPGTRSITGGVLVLTDENGGEWRHAMDVPLPPHVLGQTGYHVGAWTDGGTIHTYHGPANPAMEWDEFDFSVQPCEHTFPGTGEKRKVFGVEHLARVTTTAPDGRRTQGRAQIEVFLNGRYAPYGFEDPATQGGLSGRGMA